MSGATAQCCSLSHQPKLQSSETAGEAERIPGDRRDTAGEVAPRPCLALCPSLSTLKVEGGRRLRAGEEGQGRCDHSPEAAKRPVAHSSTLQSVASRRGPGMLGDMLGERSAGLGIQPCRPRDSHSYS